MAEKSEPMDPGAREQTVPDPVTNVGRTAYALKTLVSEVLALFPETPHEFSERDGRGVALAVMFDTTMIDGHDRDEFEALLGAVELDERVDTVVSEDDLTLVLLRSSARTQDDRSTFDLDGILASMRDESGMVFADPSGVSEPGENVIAFGDLDQSEAEGLTAVNEDEQ